MQTKHASPIPLVILLALTLATPSALAATWTTFDCPTSVATLGIYAMNSSGQMVGLTSIPATRHFMDFSITEALAPPSRFLVRTKRMRPGLTIAARLSGSTTTERTATGTR